MGAWGPGILSDDTAEDVRDDFKDLIADGLSAEDATRRLLDEWAETLADPDEAPVFWLALAATQSSMGRLQDDVRDRALAVIDSGEDLQRWEEDASAADVRKRRANLDKLRAQLTGPQKAPTKVRKDYVECSDWVVGQHWAYRLRSGRTIVLRVIDMNERYSKGGVFPVVEVLDDGWTDPPSLDEAARAQARTHRGYRYSLDDDMRPADALIITRANAKDFPADRLTLLGEAAPNKPRRLPWKRRAEPAPDPLARIPHLTWWRMLDDELAEQWGIS